MKIFIFLVVPYDRERPYSMKNYPWSPASVQPRSAVGHRTVSRTRRPRRLKGVSNSARGRSRCVVFQRRYLALPWFAGLADGPRQVHPPWLIASDSPASPAPARLKTSGEEDSRYSVDQMSVSSTYFNLDTLSSSSEDDSQDLAVTLFFDFPAESGAKDIRQV